MASRAAAALLPVGLALGAPGPAAAQAPAGDGFFADLANNFWRGWLISPRAEVVQSYSDNINSRPRGQEQSDFYTTLSPGIAIRRDSARTDFALDYDLDQTLYFRHSENDDLRHRLLHTGNYNLLRDMLFLDTRASISQQLIDPTGPESATPNNTANQNTATVRTFLIAPSLRNHFGNFADSELRFTRSNVESDKAVLSETTTNRVTATLSSGPDFSRLIWQAVLDGSETERSGDATANNINNRDSSSRLAELSGEYIVDRVWSLLGSAGYEKIEDISLSDQPNGPIWSAGFRVRPGPRTNFAAVYGDRYEDDFWSVQGSYLIGPEIRFDVSYATSLQTSQGAFRDDLNYLATDEFGSYIDARTAQLFQLSNSSLGLENNAYRQKRFEARLTGTSGRNDFGLVAYQEERETDATQTTQESYGATLRFGRALAPMTRLSLALRYRNVDTGIRNDDTYGASTTFTQTLSDTLYASLSYNLFYKDTDLPGGDTVENVISVALRKTF